MWGCLVAAPAEGPHVFRAAQVDQGQGAHHSAVWLLLQLRAGSRGAEQGWVPLLFVSCEELRTLSFLCPDGQATPSLSRKAPETVLNKSGVRRHHSRGGCGANAAHPHSAGQTAGAVGGPAQVPPPSTELFGYSRFQILVRFDTFTVKNREWVSAAVAAMEPYPKPPKRHTLTRVQGSRDSLGYDSVACRWSARREASAPRQQRDVAGPRSRTAPL